ncbi:MAG: sigma-70 family RNA polymerase sigma factor [Planctomycetes bacterium]|nr:sigma-70 family RNA polymerase sigma factor [Planctomycetota bacterium]
MNAPREPFEPRPLREPLAPPASHPSLGDDAALAGHAGFLRRLARSLLFDRAAADDVAQLALLLALERRVAGGPQSAREGISHAGDGSLRGWLAGVVRNLVRQEGREQQRRAAREERAATREPLPAAIDSAARLELSQRVLAAVQALDEPYRTAVVLRWFDGLKPAAIAKRTGVPVETARTRLKRALEQLRRRLDAGQRGGRLEWGLLLLPTALPPGGALGSIAASVGLPTLLFLGCGAVAMSGKVKALIGVAVAAAATLLLAPLLELGPWREARPRVEPPLAALASPAEVAAPSSAAAADVASRRDSLPAPELAPRDAAADASLAPLLGIARVEGGGPQAGLQLRAELYDGVAVAGAPLLEALLVSARDGAIRLALPAAPATLTLRLLDGDDDHVFVERRELLLSDRLHAPLDLVFYALDAVVTGRVLDAAGAPLPGAEVSASYADVQVACDAAGEYRLRACSSWQRWQVMAWAPGFAEAHGQVELRGPGSTATLDFRLHPHFAVAGTVRDEAGRPIAGASVRAVRHRRPPAVSDAQGQYELVGLDPQVPQQEVLAEHPDYATLVVGVRPEGETTRLDLVLQSGAAVAGVVQDGDGQPLAGALLWIGSARYLTGAPTTRSRDDGTFEFLHVPAGEVPLGASADGWPDATMRLVVPAPPQRLDGVVVRFGAGRFLAGVVVDETGAPIAGATVAASRDGSMFDRSTRSDADGSFRLVDLADAPHTFTAGASGYVRRYGLQFALDRADVRIELRRAGSLAGTVVDAETGAPIEQFRIRFVQPTIEGDEQRGSGYEMSWSEPGRSFAASDGTWRCDGEAIEPGHLFAIEASAPGYAPTVAPRVACVVDADPAALVLRLTRGATIAGTVVGDDGRPVTGARVTLATASVPVNPYQSIARDPRWLATTDERGAFEVSGAPAGASTLVVDHPDWIGAVDGPFDVPASGRASPRRIVLSRGGSIEGVLLDAAGRPAAGRLVTLFPQRSSGPFSGAVQATSDAAGRFAFGRLESATYQVSSQLVAGPVSVNELTARVAVVAPATSELRLAPTGTGRVTGRVVADSPIPTGVHVTLHRLEPAGSATALGLLADRAVLAVGDSFDVQSVEPGRYAVNVACYVPANGSWWNGASEVVVAEGESVEIVVRIAPQ